MDLNLTVSPAITGRAGSTMVDQCITSTASSSFALRIEISVVLAEKKIEHIGQVRHPLVVQVASKPEESKPPVVKGHLCRHNSQTSGKVNHLVKAVGKLRSQGRPNVRGDDEAVQADKLGTGKVLLQHPGALDDLPRAVDFLRPVDKVVVVHDTLHVRPVRVAVEEATGNVATNAGDKLVHLALHAPVGGLLGSNEELDKIDTQLGAFEAGGGNEAFHDEREDGRVSVGQVPASGRPFKTSKQTPELVPEEEMDRDEERSAANGEMVEATVVH